MSIPQIQDEIVGVAIKSFSTTHWVNVIKLVAYPRRMQSKKAPPRQFTVLGGACLLKRAWQVHEFLNLLSWWNIGVPCNLPTPGDLPGIFSNHVLRVILLVDTSYSSASRWTERSSPRNPRKKISSARSIFVFSFSLSLLVLAFYYHIKRQGQIDVLRKSG